MTASAPAATSRLAAALAAIDAAHAEDPRDPPVEPRYAERMTEWIGRLAPEASEALRIAARAQHVRRWAIPRDRFPAGRAGYLRWRTTLYAFHAEEAARILRSVGTDDSTIARVGDLLRKKGFKVDAEAQALEDAACLVFLEDSLAAFALRHDEAKVVEILRKTWKKISPAARAFALSLDLPPAARALVGKALA